jgi:glucose-6-phosphate 1-dehydrogenase
MGDSDESVVAADAFVLFGATGDLALRCPIGWPATAR